MSGCARISDRTFGTCYHPSHKNPIQIGGTIISGDGTAFVDILGMARIGDSVRTDCGHYGTISTGSSTTFASLLAVARLGDGVNGVYVATIISSSGFTFAD